jgi:hypothetical protein
MSYHPNNNLAGPRFSGVKSGFLSAILLTGLAVFAGYADEALTLSRQNPGDTSAPAKRFGLGVIVGEPTGADAKLWLTDVLAIDAAAGWSFHDHTDFYLHGDLLLHKFDLIPVTRGQLPFYIGAGGLLRFRDDHRDNQVGVRVPVGVSYMFDNAPVDIFAEVAPAIDVAPGVRGEITGGIGIRYWF